MSNNYFLCLSSSFVSLFAVLQHTSIGMTHWNVPINWWRLWCKHTSEH